MSTPPAEVDLTVTAVLDPDRAARIVLRRDVVARADDGREVSVGELWASRPCPSPFDAVDLVRDVLYRCGGELVRGMAVRMLPGLTNPTTGQLVDLRRKIETGTVGVEYLAGLRGTVEDLWNSRPVLGAADVVATDGFLATRTRHLLVDVLRALALPGAPAAEAERPPLHPERVRADLLRDLDRARLRLDQARGWARLAATRLEFVYGRPLAPGWSQAVRRTPDGVPGDRRREPDAVVAVVVSGRGGQVDLFRYPLDPRIDLPHALDDPRVQDAFTACAADPGDALGQARAVAALRGTAPGPDTGGAPDPGVPVTGHLVPTAEPLDGVVVLHDCREIAVGNDDRRITTVAHVFTPTATTGELLRTRPEIVETIVDRSCAVDDTAGGRLRTALTAAAFTAGST